MNGLYFQRKFFREVTHSKPLPKLSHHLIDWGGFLLYDDYSPLILLRMIDQKIYKKLDFIALCCLIITINNSNVDDIWDASLLVLITVLYFLPFVMELLQNLLPDFKTDKTDEDHDLDHPQDIG